MLANGTPTGTAMRPLKTVASSEAIKEERSAIAPAAGSPANFRQTGFSDGRLM
jgi:hypothetical protein